MSDVVLENTLDIKCIFLNKTFYCVYFVLGFIYFFLFLNYQIIATEKNNEVCVEKSFLEHAQSDE